MRTYNIVANGLLNLSERITVWMKHFMIVKWLWAMLLGWNIMYTVHGPVNMTDNLLLLQMKSASLRGWTDFSSMFSDKPTSLETAEGAPGEGTSLLGTAASPTSAAPRLPGKKWVSCPATTVYTLVCHIDIARGSSPSQYHIDYVTLRGYAAIIIHVITTIICCRNYGEDNKKPLLDSPEKDDGSGGWGWGEEEEHWEGWSNEQSPGASPAPDKPTDNSWNNDSWGFNDSNKSTNNAKPAKKKSKSKKEAATGNLIDFDGDAGKQQEGWDNETWAANDEEDDAWQALELDSHSAVKSSKGDWRLGCYFTVSIWFAFDSSSVHVDHRLLGLCLEFTLYW